MIRWFFLAAAATVVVGCGSEGAKEAAGDTKSISQEIPKSQPGAPHFTPAGHSLSKGDTPGAMQKGGGPANGDAGKGDAAKGPAADFKGAPGKQSGG
jgi:hypothetical protein